MKECMVLKASAGTGKTYRLSLEYIASLLRGESYRDILVMTFTKKATAEIKERIIDFLEKIVKGEGEDIIENILKLHEGLIIDKKKIEKIYKEISSNRDRVKIYTIDGFINSLFKNVVAPYLNVLNYDIIDDTENDEILNKCLEKIIENKKEFSVFKEFFEKNTERNIENYLSSIKNLISDRWKMLIIDSKENSEQKFEIEDKEKMFYCMENIIKILLEIRTVKKGKDPIESYLKTAYKNYFNLDDEEQKENYFLENWNAILKDDKCWNGTKTKPSKTADITLQIKELEEQFLELKKVISKKIFNKDILEYEKNILGFIKNLYSIYDSIKFSEKRFTHTDISSYTFKNITNPDINLMDEDGVTDYFLEIFDGELKTLFIDEFQDTSILQWKILKGIINKTSRVICVGDEKQSIYGWRGGEKSLFENLEKILQSKIESLDTSYRSKKHIVDFTNQIFSNISENYNEENKEKSMKWNFEKVTGKSQENGYVEIINVEKDSELSQSETLADDIQNKFKGNYTNIAIIARTNSELNEISFSLSERKIPYVLESNESIIKHRAIESIYKLIKYLVNKDFFYLLEFLRSDTVNISNEVLKEILVNREVVEKYLNSETAEDIGIISDILNKIKELNRIVLTTNGKVDEILIKLIKDFGIVGLYKTKSDLKNLYFFLELLREYENLYDFVSSLDDKNNSGKFKQVSLEDKNAVTLMTIHKSKGLEYETVYYYHKPTGNSSHSGLRFHVDLSLDYETVMEYIFIDKKYEKVMGYLGEKYNYIQTKEDKNEQEELNALYVVLTRAKTNLILVLGEKIDNYLKMAIEDSSEKSFGKFSIELIEDKEIDIKEELLELDFEKTLLKEGEVLKNLEKMRETHKEFSLETENKRLVGTAVHYYLENIIYNTSEERERAKLKTMSQYGALIGEEKLFKILNSKELKMFIEKNQEIFSQDWDYIYPEYEIYSNISGNLGLKRIDRIMIKKNLGNERGKILIVDYKTGGKDEEQIAEYVQLIKNQLVELNEIQNYEIVGKFMEIKL